MSEHAKELEPKILGLHQQLTKLAAGHDSERFLQIVRRPGWTTPQEAQLVHAMFDSLSHHLAGVDKSYRALIDVAEHIGQAAGATK